MDSGNQNSYYSQSLDSINSILSITKEQEMTQKISNNLPKLYHIFSSFKTKLYNNQVTQNDINQITEALKFVDTLNLFMSELDVQRFKEKMGEINSILRKRNYDFKELIANQIQYTEMTIINYRNSLYRDMYFNNHKGLSDEIEKELDQVNKNKFDFKLFKQMQNIFWVVKNVIDEPKKTELDNRLKSMKIISRNIKEKKYGKNNSYSNQGYRNYDDYRDDKIDYRNYSGTYDYNDNFFRNEDSYYNNNKFKYDDYNINNRYDTKNTYHYGRSG